MYRLEDNIFLSEPVTDDVMELLHPSWGGRGDLPCHLPCHLSLQRRQGNHHSPKGRVGDECFFPCWHSLICSSRLNIRSINLEHIYIYEQLRVWIWKLSAKNKNYLYVAHTCALMQVRQINFLDCLNEIYTDWL